MKKFPLFITALLIIIASCNKIDTTKEVYNIIGPVSVTPWNPDYATTVSRKIYMEEFTGHTCTYCPAGANILKGLMDEYPFIVATAIHCTELADPLSIDFFQNNYKTPMGDAICKDFQIAGLPKATVNRTENGANGWGFDRNQWRKEVEKVNRTNVCAGIELLCAVNEITEEIEAQVGVTIIKTIPNPVQLCVILQQDGFISGQVDGGQHILDYVHNHVLRASFNGNYGTKLTPNGIVKEHLKYSTSFKINYGNSFPYSQLPVIIEHCSVVAYLIDYETKEVLQVESIHLE